MELDNLGAVAGGGGAALLAVYLKEHLPKWINRSQRNADELMADMRAERDQAQGERNAEFKARIESLERQRGSDSNAIARLQQRLDDCETRAAQYLADKERAEVMQREGQRRGASERLALRVALDAVTARLRQHEPDFDLTQITQAISLPGAADDESQRS